MTKISVILLLAFTISLTACKKEDAKSVTPTTTSPTTNPNPNPNPTPTNIWTWTGTPPLSAKVDGTSFQPDVSTLDVFEAIGYISIVCYNTAGDAAITISLLTSVETGKEYTMPSPCNISYATYDASSVLTSTFSASTGKYKIINITATEIEGFFYADMFEPVPSGNGTISKITEGYFKVNR